VEAKSGANYTPYYYHADGLGSITGLSDATGTMVQQYSYDAFGNVVATGSVAQPFMFTGREYDSETGMYFYRARYYDPAVGRFVTKDPIGFGGGDYNLYGYVGNNPSRFMDPLGLWRSPWRIYDEASADAQSKFPEKDLWNGPGDAYRHCLASCMTARENGDLAARIFGWANEKKGDWLESQERGEREMDDFNNLYGRQCAQGSKSTQDCQQKCMEAANGGKLKTYNSGTTRGYWR